ncbi:uncharacterized protein LOC112351018 [Selaginella moellendorffii]|uniref:uncharacterized protein LOC112344937 n=1 Tax=Selaginella moellendorffii TaxID=88036 RepID=UPI000D1C34C6|nr:uncharacterized protein LOC112344937 [Selaginella moellendorffii]XP_024543897.1 uncharacterized protein LOC112351018 [Selaginella moellendorffii]|eukprot:XP_024526360.1 uncharacterized protein LOC112344937 [Selaginella moellendorffii]
MAESVEPRRTIGARVFLKLNRNGHILGAISAALAGIMLVVKMKKAEELLNEHRTGLCGLSDGMAEENRRLKQGLMSLRQRVLDEVSRDGKKLPPLPTRLKQIFDSVQ